MLAAFRTWWTVELRTSVPCLAVGYSSASVPCHVSLSISFHNVVAGFIRAREEVRQINDGGTRVILKPNLLSDISSLLPNSICYMHVTRYIGVWGLHKGMNTGDRNNWDTVEPVTPALCS
jgi:hypothetical protein